MAGAMYRRSAIGSSKSDFLKVHARDPFNQEMILFVKMQSMDPQVSVYLGFPSGLAITFWVPLTVLKGNKE